MRALATPPAATRAAVSRALARSIDVDFRRVQFTPDLLPSDILGVAIYAQQSGAFEFKPGPIFTHVLLADELKKSGGERPNFLKV